MGRVKASTVGLVTVGLAGVAGGYFLTTNLSSQCRIKLVHGPTTAIITKGDKELTLLDIITEECPLLAHPDVAYFYPTVYLWSGHLQTVFNALMAKKNDVYNDVDYERELLYMDDGGNIALDWAPSFEAAPSDNRPVVVILHGLTGGSLIT